MARTKTIAVDFDGVINSYASGWVGGLLPDPPVPGAFDFLARAVARFDVVVFSTRAKGGVEGMREWFLKHGLPEDVLEVLKITHEKPPAVVYLDDRGWTFEGRFPSLDDVDAFVPWNKREAMSDEARALRGIGLHQAARDLFDNRLGFGEGRLPYAPRKFWADLGAALYGEDDPRVRQLRSEQDDAVSKHRREPVRGQPRRWFKRDDVASWRVYDFMAPGMYFQAHVTRSVGGPGDRALVALAMMFLDARHGRPALHRVLGA